METITLISGRRKVVCSNPIYYARAGGGRLGKVVPSHLVASPPGNAVLGEVSYVQLKDARVPILVAHQPDGSVWLGGAYLDVIASELKLIPRPVPDEMRGKSKAWLEAVAGRWRDLPQTPPQTTGSKPGPGWNGYADESNQSSGPRHGGVE